MTDPDKEIIDGVPRLRKEPRPDFSKPLPHTRLPPSIQQTLDSEEKLWEALNDQPETDSTETNARYAGYAARARTILNSAHRYVAYTSDIGESFRPVAHPWLVRSAYGISWAYIGGDVVYEGYKAYKHNQRVLNPVGALASVTHRGDQTQSRAEEIASIPHLQPGKVAPLDDYRTVMAQRLIFQSVASMGLPAFTIHSIVRYSGRAMKNLKNQAIRTWGPIGLGLAAVPFLPYMFDKPVEHAVEWIFHTGFSKFGGHSFVHSTKPLIPVTGEEIGKHKDKEL